MSRLPLNIKYSFAVSSRLLCGIYRGFEVLARHDRTVIGQQDGVVFARDILHGVGERQVARRVIGQQHQVTDLHHVVRRDLRDGLLRIGIREAENNRK